MALVLHSGVEGAEETKTCEDAGMSDDVITEFLEDLYDDYIYSVEEIKEEESVHVRKRRKRATKLPLNTPKDLLTHITHHWQCNCLPCPPYDSPVDALAPEVMWGTRNFLNPPWDNIRAWFRKANQSHIEFSLFLVPFRPEAHWFWDEIMASADVLIALQRGRPRFEHYQKPYVSAICYVLYTPNGRAPILDSVMNSFIEMMFIQFKKRLQLMPRVNPLQSK